MTYRKSFALTILAYLITLIVYLLGQGDAEPVEKQTVIATSPGEGKAQPKDAGEGERLVESRDQSERSPKTGANRKETKDEKSS